MTNHHKLLVGAGVVGVALVLYLRRRAGGEAFLGELTVTRDAEGRCGCFEVDTSTGVVRTKKVALSRCAADPALATEMAQCTAGTGPFDDATAALGRAVDFFKNMFAPPSLSIEKVGGQCLCGDADGNPRPLDECKAELPTLFARFNC